MKKIDVENIMHEIRTEIKSKGYSYEDLSFGEVEELRRLYDGDFDEQEFDEELQIVRQIYYIEEYPMKWNNSLGGKVKFNIKKFLRKFMSFYVMPIVQKQNNYNKAVSKTLNQVDAYIATNDKHIKLLEKKVAELTQEVKRLKER